MVFSSVIFLFAFLPIFLAAYYSIPHKMRSALILVASYIFYAWWRLDFTLLFFTVTLFNYIISRMMLKMKKEKKPFTSKSLLFLGISGNVLTLAYFKYFNFGIDTLNNLLLTLSTNINQIRSWYVILPIGISFYIFQAISYLIDVYREDARPAQSFWDFSAFISLFPQLIAGPILRYKDIASQFTHRSHTLDKFSEGSYRFMLGFCKKVVVADTMGLLVDRIFALNHPSMADAWLGAISYTVQLYFDFSGYSDMAVGLGLMMGFRFVENFNYPYTSRSITEFWRRWHISLSNWLRDYLYIPLGGNRKGSKRTYVNLLITMLVGGLWHGAAWTFVLWGGMHGSILAIERFLKERYRKVHVYGIFGWPVTLLIVILGWVIFRAEDINTASQFYRAMFNFHNIGFSDNIIWQITGLEVYTLITAIMIIFLEPNLSVSLNKLVDTNGKRLWSSKLSYLAIIFIFILAILKLVAQDYSPFLYFQF